MRIAAQSQDGWVDVQVADDGVGMSQELLSQFFQPFFSTKIGRGGTGLGTTIVENLVKETLGGTLAVQSTLGQGTTFLIRIPLSAPQDDEMVFDANN